MSESKEKDVSSSKQPRSGKGIGIIIPNLVKPDGSAVVLDPLDEKYIKDSQETFDK